MSPDEMRTQAKQYVARALEQQKTANLTTAETVQVSVITDQVNAFTLVAIADLLENLNPDSRKARAKKILEFNDSIRRAAAKGFNKNDWSEFDKLVDAGLPDGTAGETSGNSSP